MDTRTLIFDTRGNEKQKEVCRYWSDEVTTDILYGGSKGSGKSYLGCSLIFGDALTYPNTFYFIAPISADFFLLLIAPGVKY